MCKFVRGRASRIMRADNAAATPKPKRSARRRRDARKQDTHLFMAPLEPSEMDATFEQAGAVHALCELLSPQMLPRVAPARPLRGASYSRVRRPGAHARWALP